MKKTYLIISEYKDGVEKHFYKLENNVITKTEHYHNFVQAELRKKEMNYY